MRLRRRNAEATGRPPSEAIRLFAYDDAAQRLYVTFPEGRTYVYFPLPPADYQRFIAAPSHGAHLNAVIKRTCSYQLVSRIPPLLRAHRG